MVQVHCELDGELMCCLRRAVVVWRHLQPLPQGDPNLQSHVWVSHLRVDLVLGGEMQAKQVLQYQKQVFGCPCGPWEVFAVPAWEGEDVARDPAGSLCGRAEQPSLPATLAPLPLLLRHQKNHISFIP